MLHQPLYRSLAWRYLKSGRADGFVSFVTIASVAGIALGVAALITVMSVMNGFHSEIRNKLLSAVPHVTVMSGDGVLSPWPSWQQTLQSQEQVVAVAPLMQLQAMLLAGDNMRPVALRALLPEAEKNFSRLSGKALLPGVDQLVAGEFSVWLGEGLADQLGAKVGSTVLLVLPDSSAATSFLPRMKNLKVAGVFAIGMYEYDQSLALMHMSDAQKLMRYAPDAVNALQVLTPSLDLAPQVARRLNHTFGGQVIATSWADENRSFFAALALEKRMLAIILSLIVMVAAFNLVSGLVMGVIQKRSNIAILMTLGASPQLVRRVFLLQGFATGALGSLLGVGLGLVLSWNLNHVLALIDAVVGSPLISPQVYHLSYLPTQIWLSDVLAVVALSLLLSLAATWYPARQAGAVMPAAVLREAG